MLRKTRKVFTGLTIWMVGLGLVIGFLFPFFIFAMGVPSQYVLTQWFFAACMVAGFIIGAANVILAKVLVGRKLLTLADSMRRVEDYLEGISQDGDIGMNLPEFFTLEVDSEDELGTSTQAFNSLVQSQLSAVRTGAAVREFEETIASQKGLNDLADKALLRLIQDSAASAGAILVLMKGEFRVASSHGISSPENLTESDHVRLAQQTKEIQTVKLPEDTLVESDLYEVIPKEIIVVPILYKSEILGVIVLASSSGFRDKDKKRMMLFLRALTLAMRNSIERENLQQLADLDPLSGMYNRRFGLSRLQEEFNRAVRVSAPLSVLMCDIDHFKKINDTYGHLIGDRVINHFVDITRPAVRKSDIVVRYGGDEFLLIFPGATKEDVMKIGDRIRSLVRELEIPDVEQKIRVTISMGIAEYLSDEIDNANDLVNKADSRLYEAKEVGRDRVVAE